LIDFVLQFIARSIYETEGVVLAVGVKAR
jgi:hypothetical protein